MSVASTLVKINLELEGIPPGLLFQGKGKMELDGDSDGKIVKKRPPEEEARLLAHWMKSGGKKMLAIPWVMFYRSFCKSASRFKGPRKMTMESYLATTISCEQEKISLGTDQFEVFEEYVRIPPRKGGMVKIGRPLLPQWSCKITFLADCEVYTPEILEKIIQEAGKTVGIGAWRPMLKGPYGRFLVKKFEIEK